MTLLEQLQAAAENARKGLPAALTIDANGVQYTRNFMPQERLILLGGGTIAQPQSAASFRFRKWIFPSGISLGTSTTFLPSFRQTSAARKISVSA